MLRWALALLLACSLAGALHLARPNPEAHTHAAPLIGSIRYGFNADSPLFARLVVDFPHGLWDSEQGKIRILRPLYPALGYCVYLPMSPMASFVPASLTSRVQRLTSQSNHPEIWASVDPRRLVLAWAALVVVNVAISWLSAILTMVALARIFPVAEAFWLALLVVFHFNAIDFMLVPHSEVFNLLVPAVTLAALIHGKGRPEPARATAFLLGVLMLGKALVFPLVNWLLRRKPTEILLLLSLFALPGAVYSAVLYTAGLPPTSTPPSAR